MIKLEAPQIIYLVFLLLNMGICIARYGQPKTDHYDVCDVIVGPAVMLSLLWWGGFFG